MTEVLNRQRKVPVDTARLREFAARTCEAVEETGGSAATIVLVSDRRIRELNRDFRGKNTATDVLSFPFGDDDGEGTFLGDVVISSETAARQAKENGLSLEAELEQLALHGILHLCGYDHETDGGEMDALELMYRKRLGINA